MRKLSPPKAISHALNSVLTYRREALRIGMFWIPVLIVLGLGKILVGAPDPEATELDGPMLVEIVSTAIAFVAFSSIAVSWHRFILRDEVAVPWRLDAPVLRYAGNSLLIVLMVGVPVVLMLLVTVTGAAIVVHPASSQPRLRHADHSAFGQASRPWRSGAPTSPSAWPGR